MTARLTFVVAVARNGVIGVDGALAWKISDDLKWFKSVTMGKPIIMGRKTFDSIGRALPGRDNIVITRRSDFTAKGVFIARSLDGAVKLAQACAGQSGAAEVCVIGGAQIYRQLLPLAERIYLTRVDAEVEGDAYFPALDSTFWTETSGSACKKSPVNEYDCDFFIMDRSTTEKPRNQ